MKKENGWKIAVKPRSINRDSEIRRNPTQTERKIDRHTHRLKVNEKRNFLCHRFWLTLNAKNLY